MFRCTLFRRQTDVCYACGKVGHRADVCPTPDEVICRGCGKQSPSEEHDCKPMCKLCGGAHVTADRKCKQRFQIPYVVRHRRKERQKQDSNPCFQRGYTAEDFPPLHTVKPGGTSAPRCGRSHSKGSRSRSKGRSDSIARSRSRTPSVRITTQGPDQGPWATRAKKMTQPEEYLLTAIEVPFVCKDVVQVPVDHDFVRDIEIDGHLLADKLLIPGMAAVPGISLLIGADQLWQFMSGETKRYHGQKSLVAMGSALGWMLQGPLCFDTSLELGLNVCVLGLSTSSDSTDEVLWRFRGLESVGIMPADNSTPTKETNGKLERFEQEILHEIKQEIQETHPEVDRCRQTGQDPPVVGDAQVIEVELAKHEVLMNDIEAYPGSVDTLNRAGRQLIEVDRHSEYAIVRQTEVVDLNRRWKALQDKAAERQQQLEAALREAQAFNQGIQNLLMWLSDTEGQLASSKPVGGLPATLAEPREKFRVPRGRQTVKKLIRPSNACVKKRLKPSSAPVAPVTSERVRRSDIFLYPNEKGDTSGSRPTVTRKCLHRKESLEHFRNFLRSNQITVRDFAVGGGC
ncbi:hypothetical protein MTO96_017491 [Rhipicephalus appendiculatus]